MTTRILGTLLGTRREQTQDGDQYPIDPALIGLRRNIVPVRIEFEGPSLGNARVWREDGRLLFEALLHNVALARYADGSVVLGRAVPAYDLEAYDEAKHLIPGGELFEVGLVQGPPNYTIDSTDEDAAETVTWRDTLTL